MLKKLFCARCAFLVVLAAVALLPSCRSAVENARRNIRVEAVEKVELRALSGFDLTLRVRNNTKYKLVLRSASLSLWYGGSQVADMILREGLEVPRRTTGSVILRWKLGIEDPIALYLLSRRFAEGDLSQMTVSYAVEGRGGPVRVNISQEQMPLSDFLRTFGLSVDDVKSYLSE